MKYFLIFLTLFLFSFSLHAAEKNLVCFPSIDPSYRSINFQIKPSKGSCGKEEQVFEVKRGEGQAVLFIPYEAANSQPANGIPGNPRPATQALPY